MLMQKMQKDWCMQVQFLEDDKTGLLLFHAENIDGVIELDNGKPSRVSSMQGQTACPSLNQRRKNCILYVVHPMRWLVLH